MRTIPRGMIEADYFRHAQQYLASLPPTHFMEATTQSHQRAITLASLALVAEQRSEFQVFNELLVQYRIRGKKKPGQVVPDNMVILHDEPIKAEGSFDAPIQPAKPFWVLEYVSKSNKRKDYEDNMEKYERELKVPYYLTFYPETQDLTLFHLSRGKYRTVLPNSAGRLEIPEVEMEMALVGEWVRFWYRGELLPLPGELLRKFEAQQQRNLSLETQVVVEQQRSQSLETQVVVEQQRTKSLEERVAELEAELKRLRQKDER